MKGIRLTVNGKMASLQSSTTIMVKVCPNGNRQKNNHSTAGKHTTGTGKGKARHGNVLIRTHTHIQTLEIYWYNTQNGRHRLPIRIELMQPARPAYTHPNPNNNQTSPKWKKLSQNPNAV